MEVLGVLTSRPHAGLGPGSSLPTVVQMRRVFRDASASAVCALCLDSDLNNPSLKETKQIFLEEVGKFEQ